MPLGRPVHPLGGSHAPELYIVTGYFTVGASGAISTTAGAVKMLGASNVEKETTAGQYTITLKDAYTLLMGWSIGELYASAADITFQVLSQTVATEATKTIVIQAKKGSDGTAVNPASGALVYCTFLLSKSRIDQSITVS